MLRNTYGISLVVQGLGPGTFIAVAQVQSLVRELKFLKPHGATKKKKKKEVSMASNIKGQTSCEPLFSSHN